MMLGSLPCVIASIYDLATKTDPAGALTAGVFFAIVAVLGLGLGIWGFRTPKVASPFEDADFERRLLQFAREHDGVVTVSQLAAESPLSATEAREALESLERIGVCHSSPSATGGLFYNFPDFMPDGTRTPSDVEFDFSEDDSVSIEEAATVASSSSES